MIRCRRRGLPGYPDRFGSQQDAHDFCTALFDWHHHQHRHSALGWITPADVHYGRAEALRDARTATLADAYRQQLERFVRGIPTPPALPEAGWINLPTPARAGAL